MAEHTDKTTEEMIIENGLTAPRVTKKLIDGKIKDVEFVKYTTIGNKTLRWCVITMQNGFAIAGEPSASVSTKNDDKEIGESIAYKSAYERIWAYEGYLLATELKKIKLQN